MRTPALLNSIRAPPQRPPVAQQSMCENESHRIARREDLSEYADVLSLERSSRSAMALKGGRAGTSGFGTSGLQACTASGLQGIRPL